jgi:hypothetical protein
MTILITTLVATLPCRRIHYRLQTLLGNHWQILSIPYQTYYKGYFQSQIHLDDLLKSAIALFVVIDLMVLFLFLLLFRKNGKVSKITIITDDLYIK